jgi:glycerophosphoryl diester phosphodiesterase
MLPMAVAKHHDDQAERSGLRLRLTFALMPSAMFVSAAGSDRHRHRRSWGCSCGPSCWTVTSAASGLITPEIVSKADHGCETAAPAPRERHPVIELARLLDDPKGCRVVELIVLRGSRATEPSYVGNTDATPRANGCATMISVITDVALIAHRLGREPGPDSSRAALASTLGGPVDGLETDVCLTADGRLALLHDPWLSTGTTASGWAHETDWGRLRHVRLRDRHGVATNQTPMLLDELLDGTPSTLGLQVEVKAHGDPSLARATAVEACRMAQSQAGQRSIEILSFYTAACEEAARLGVPARLIVWADYEPEALIDWAARTGVAGVCVEHFLLRAELTARFRLAGLSVSTGTINDAMLARRACALGVEAITTDRPAALHSELTEMSLAA